MSVKYFVVSMGRSGTSWLSDLINSASHYNARHEPRGNEQNACIKAYYDQDEAYKYVESLDFDKNMVEVNSYLRYHAKALLENGRQVRYLVRNGKDCVSSMMQRNSVYLDDEWQINMEPKEDDPFYDEWESFNPFQKTCWYWWNANKYLNDQFDEHYKLEEITTNWYRMNVMFPFKIDRDVWEDMKDDKRNENRVKPFPYPDDWSTEQHDQFNQICGDLMKELNYYNE